MRSCSILFGFRSCPKKTYSRRSLERFACFFGAKTCKHYAAKSCSQDVLKRMLKQVYVPPFGSEHVCIQVLPPKNVFKVMLEQFYRKMRGFRSCPTNVSKTMFKQVCARFSSNMFRPRPCPKMCSSPCSCGLRTPFADHLKSEYVLSFNLARPFVRECHI